MSANVPEPIEPVPPAFPAAAPPPDFASTVPPAPPLPGSDSTPTAADGLDQQGADARDQQGLDKLDQRGADKLDQRGADGLDQQGLDKLDQRGLDKLDQRGADGLDQQGLVPVPVPLTGASPSPDPATALSLFVNARIGGEAIPSTATSELMLRTVTKALGSAATLIDSPALGLQGAKPVTKTLRGAGLAVYLLSDTLAGHGRKRGLGLAVLALGAALVAIALLSGAAPAWLATAGFGILLGGLAYAALASGMLSLAMVLATPVVPLLVWSATQGGPDDDSGASRLVQIGLIVGLIVTALVMGLVRSPEARPTFANWLRVVGAVSAFMVAVAVLVWLARTIAVPPWLGIAVLLVGAAAVVALGLLALRHVAELEESVITAKDPARAERRAVVAAWAWTYGAGYIVFAIVLAGVLRLVPPANPDAGMTLLALVGTFLVLAVVCFGLCLRTKRLGD